MIKLNLISTNFKQLHRCSFCKKIKNVWIDCFLIVSSVWRWADCVFRFQASDWSFYINSVLSLVDIWFSVSSWAEHTGIILTNARTRVGVFIKWYCLMNHYLLSFYDKYLIIYIDLIVNWELILCFHSFKLISWIASKQTNHSFQLS